MLDQIPPGYDLNLVPAGMAPPGADPTIGGGESLGVAMVVLESVMMGIAVIVVLMRFFSSWSTRRTATGGLNASDWSCLVALIISMGQSSIIVTMHDYARHQWNISVGMMTDSYFKRIFSQYFIAWVAIFLAKFSILWLYRHLFGIKKSMRVAVYIGIAWAAITYLPNMAIAANWCAARWGQPWDFSVGMRCAEKLPLKWLVASAAMSVILDIYIFVLPIPVVMGLRLSGRKRFGVLIIFTTAASAIVCAVLTLVYRVKLLKTTDSMWLSAQLFICNGVENYIAIIVGAMPGCSSYFKSHIAKSKFFSAVSSMFTSVGSRGDKSSKGGSGGSGSGSGAGAGAGAHYKLDDVSDTESQRWLRPSDGQIAVKSMYDVRTEAA